MTLCMHIVILVYIETLIPHPALLPPHFLHKSFQVVRLQDSEEYLGIIQS